MGLSFDFDFSTAGENRSAELYNEESESSLLYRDFFQVDICHDWWPWCGPQRPEEGDR